MKAFICLLFCLLLSGCASVQVSSIDSQEYLKQRRGDVISQGHLSEQNITVLTALGLSDCENNIDTCLKTVSNSKITGTDQKLSALAEMWLFKAMKTQKDAKIRMQNREFVDEENLVSQLVNDYLEAARYAYAYLFFSDRTISSRALEDRQTQVKDYYNFAVQNAIEQLYIAAKGKPIQFPIREKNWEISIAGLSAPELSQPDHITDIIPDTVLSFKGLKNQYSQDGLGARMVLSAKEGKEEKDQPWRLMPYSAITAMISFPGKNLSEITQTHEALITTYDASTTGSITIGKTRVPLSANFSGAYGLWLASSAFAVTSFTSIFGRGTIIDRPAVFLMRPYQKNLRTIILIHGLASSPEAWVNTANEIMGDKILRDHFQIWQVYYPTNVPLLINRYEIAEAINKTIDHFDPSRSNIASRGITLIGHSMGGILARLLVSSSGDVLLDALEKKYPAAGAKLSAKSSKFSSIIKFEPLRGVSDAIFLAAPHRGTPYADASWAKYLASFVKLPLSIVNTVGEMALTIFGRELPREISMTGVDNLSAKDPTVKILEQLKISPNVKYFSIIGRENPEGPLEESSDGIVPYWSSHLDGAASETVVVSGHSVQETPQAILKIREILRSEIITKPTAR